jgi:hypothetical protein
VAEFRFNERDLQRAGFPESAIHTLRRIAAVLGDGLDGATLTSLQQQIDDLSDDVADLGGIATDVQLAGIRQRLTRLENIPARLDAIEARLALGGL